MSKPSERQTYTDWVENNARRICTSDALANSIVRRKRQTAKDSIRQLESRWL